MTVQEKIALLREYVAKSDRIVFFGGAGVSTESGIPDFRSVDGLYRQQWDYPPEMILSHEFFESKTAEFYRFYRAKMICPDAKPNPAHLRLAQLEKEGKLTGVVTQNIDGLHQAAGSRKVIELHGSTLRNYCTLCGKAYTAEDILATEDVPRCSCGGVIKPDVVLYGESLNLDTLNDAVDAIADADTMIIGGTSLNVYPAAGLVKYFSGRHLIMINLSTTPQDDSADLLINERIGSVFSQI
ncbi:MAG: NAD-dependent protein deacylase [Ruminococcus sp.]|nr:NAD-dependent protein deacylase [Ruminococcus sp.]